MAYGSYTTTNKLRQNGFAAKNMYTNFSNLIGYENEET